MENKTQNLAYWRQNAEEDYMTTPISVLRYITEMEKALNTSGVSKCHKCGVRDGKGKSNQCDLCLMEGIC
jgi:hypothetical protein